MTDNLFNPAKILLVTSSVELAQELRKVLDSYLVIVVEDANQAIEKLNKTKDISALLVGIFLNNTHGFELLDYLKEHPSVYTGPVLAVTDSITDKVISQVKSYNIFDFIVRYSDDLILKTRVRNAVVYYSDREKLLNYAAEQVYQNLNDAKMFVLLLAQVVEFKNYESGQHVANVSLITKILAKNLIKMFPDKYSISKKDIEYISLAAALHDIGKVYIPDYILNKPGKLTASERKIMQTHATLGAGIIKRLPNYKDRPAFNYAHEICLAHHERFDGSGYPFGLIGNNIPIAAQIVSAADCYDALTSDRIYRKALTSAEAIQLMQQGECGVFNKDIIDCFLASIDEITMSLHIDNNTTITKEAISEIIKEVCKIK